MHNLGLKLVSLLVAVMIWLIIVYTYDPVDTAEFTLDVTILNEDAITSLNKVYEVIEGDTVTIQVKGNTTQVNSLKASDFKATADISKLSPTYHASIDVVCTKTNNVEISFLGKVNMLAISLEDVAQKQFKVTVVPDGTPVEGYYVGPSTTKPNLIQVQGAKSAIERIDQVRVVTNVTGETGSFRSEVVPKAYDKDGKEITTGSLTFSKSLVSVATTIYATKEIPIEIQATGKPYSGYRLVNVEYEPKTVIVAGEEDALASIHSVKVPLSVANRITNLEENVSLDEYMPEDIYLKDTSASVNVLMEVERLATKTYMVPYNTIQLRDADPEVWDYKIVQNGTFAVKVMGRQQDLDKLDLVSLRPYIDVLDLKEEGTHAFTVQFDLEEDFEVMSVSTVMIQVIARPELPPVGEDQVPDGDLQEGEIPEGEEPGDSDTSVDDMEQNGSTGENE